MKNQYQGSNRFTENISLNGEDFEVTFYWSQGRPQTRMSPEEPEEIEIEQIIWQRKDMITKGLNKVLGTSVIDVTDIMDAFGHFAEFEVGLYEVAKQRRQDYEADKAEAQYEAERDRRMGL